MKMDEVKSFVDLVENGVWVGKLVKITGEHSQAGSEGIVRNFIREEGEDNFAVQVAVDGRLIPVENASDLEAVDSDLTFENERPVRTRKSDLLAEGQVFEPVDVNPNAVPPVTLEGKQIVEEGKEQMEKSVQATEGVLNEEGHVAILKDTPETPDNLFEPNTQEPMNIDPNDTRANISEAIRQNAEQREAEAQNRQQAPDQFPDLSRTSPLQNVNDQTKDAPQSDPKPEVKKADSNPKTVKP